MNIILSMTKNRDGSIRIIPTKYLTEMDDFLNPTGDIKYGALWQSSECHFY